MQIFTIVWAGTWFLQFDEQVPDGHSGPVCGYGLQPSLLPPRSHLQVNQSDLLLLLFYKSISGTSLPCPGCGVSTKSLIEGSFFAPALCLSFTIFPLSRYRKNLKSCFIVHPTNFIKVVYNFFKPIISVKFGRKIQWVFPKPLLKIVNNDTLYVYTYIEFIFFQVCKPIEWTESVYGPGETAHPQISHWVSYLSESPFSQSRFPS